MTAMTPLVESQGGGRSDRNYRPQVPSGDCWNAPDSRRDRGLKRGGGWRSALENDEKQSTEDVGDGETTLTGIIMVGEWHTLSRCRMYNPMSEL